MVVAQSHEFYDFEAKYLAEDDVRAGLPGGRAGRRSPAEMTALAARAFEVAGCEGLARVDFFFTETADVLLNEINTMPGFTPQSMYPRMWAAQRAELPRADRRAAAAGAGAPLGLR